MSSSSHNPGCPLSIPVPISITVNTSGSPVSPLSGVHSLSATHGGFTRISKFTFNPVLTSTGLDINDYLPSNISTVYSVWDFGDGYSLSGADTFTNATHVYNVPGVYTVSLFFYDLNGNPYLNTLSETVSVYNYGETFLELNKEDNQAEGSNVTFNTKKIFAGKKELFDINVTSTWQDVPVDEKFTLYLTASGSKSKAYDTNSKYSHLMPFNAFYDENNNLLENNDLDISKKLKPKYYAVEPSTNKIWQIDISKLTVEELKEVNVDVYNLAHSTKDTIVDNELVAVGYNSTSQTFLTGSTDGTSVKFKYLDDTPNILDTGTGVRILAKLDTSKHQSKGFYVDELSGNLNLSEKNYLQGPGFLIKNGPGILTEIVRVDPDFNDIFSFTSTGVPEMSSIDYKRQGDKFQVFVALQDINKSLIKNYPVYNKAANLNNDFSFLAQWVSGSYTSDVSSISTEYFPYNTSTSTTELSNFLYLNVNPLSAGTWSLNVTARIDSLSASFSDTNYVANRFFNANVNSGNSGLLSGSKTFTVLPSTNDVELYKQNEDVDYSQVLKGYRFQSFLHEYEKLFDGIFTSFVGEASSSPTTFGKTIIEKIANFTSNHSDVDSCNISQLQSFYDLFNEDVDILLPTAPPGLKRLYDLLSIKLSKLLGDYTREQQLSTNFSTTSAEARNIDLENPITTSTYTVTAYTEFVAQQKFNNEFILIKPQKVATKNVDGTSSGISTTYPLSAYNVYSNWGWPLDTSVSGADGLDKFYNFYPYVEYNRESTAHNIENNVIDYTNQYTGVSRTVSAVSAWEDTGGVIYKNLDYQIREGLNL